MCERRERECVWIWFLEYWKMEARYGANFLFYFLKEGEEIRVL